MNEFELIEKITHGAPRSGEYLVCGAGDDCAVIKGANGKDFLVTTDALFEGVHFKREWTTPKTLGRKALSVNVSDICAMGGRAQYFLVSIGIPEDMPETEVESLFDGMAQSANSFRMSLIGGDTCKSAKGLLLSLTVIGECDTGKAIYRKGAKPGDAVYATGTFGDSALGLACLEKGIRNIHVRNFIKKHDDPTPRTAISQWLSESGCVSSMIDISDGLMADLNHIADASKVQIIIDAKNIPFSDGFIESAGLVGKDGITLALSGGEDYELAFTVHSAKRGLFEKMLNVVLPTFGHKVTKIGEVLQGEGVHAVDVHGTKLALANKGFEHKW